jgi:hypothetical protein
LRLEIRFCTARDGVKLAVGSYGSGPPLVRAATWLTHIEHDATSAALRQVFVAKFMGEASEAQRQAFDERQRATSSPTSPRGIPSSQRLGPSSRPRARARRRYRP